MAAFSGNGMAISGQYNASSIGGRRDSLGLRRVHGRLIVITRLPGQLLAPLFFLLVFLGEISLAFFELVVWFGQEASSDRHSGV